MHAGTRPTAGSDSAGRNALAASCERWPATLNDWQTLRKCSDRGRRALARYKLMGPKVAEMLHAARYIQRVPKVANHFSVADLTVLRAIGAALCAARVLVKTPDRRK